MRHHLPNPASAQLVKLALSDGSPSPTATDGRPLLVTTVTKRTNNFKLRVFSFYTAKLQSDAGALHNVSPVTDMDYGDITLKVYDSSNTLITTDGGLSGACKTIADFVPTYNYEVMGGFMDVPPSLIGGTSDQWFISAIGVPDYPAIAGGSLDHISEANIEALSSTRLAGDGRAVSYLAYNFNGNPNTNKIRWIVKYPAGVSKRFQVYLEHYV